MANMRAPSGMASPLQPARITGAVEIFLVGQHDFGGLAQEWDADQHVVADLAVRAHDRAFVVGQRTGLAQDAVGNGHLADVVQEGGPRQLRHVRGVDTHGLGDFQRENHDALAVAFGFGILEVERAAQGLQRFVVGFFELRKRVFQFGGALLHQAFEVFLVAAIFDDEAAMFERPANAHQQLVSFERFEDVVVGAAAHGFERRRNVVHRRDHDYRYVAVVRAQPGKQLQPVHFRHDHVAQDQIHGVLAERFQRLAAVADGEAPIPLRLQQGGDNLPDRFFVVGNQNVIFRHAGSASTTGNYR